MKVDGDAFRRSREEVRKNTSRNRGNAKQPGVGTQEWLASKTGLSSRLIQRLEKGEASIETVDKVSSVLKLNGREFIHGYGENCVTLNASGYIDLRPSSNPKKFPEEFGYSSLMLTIDPMFIGCSDDDFSHYRLKAITSYLSFDNNIIEFEWAYKVSLVSGSRGWLPIEEELRSMEITTPSVMSIPIMFRQSSNIKLSWDQFISKVEATSDNLMKIEVKLKFDNFHKILKIGLCIELLKNYITQGRLLHNSQWPYRTQLKAMTWSN